jgi:hypothetical protein
MSDKAWSQSSWHIDPPAIGSESREEDPLCAAEITHGVRCPDPPFAEFQWPGADKPSRQCLSHTRKAVDIARVLGFVLPIRRL